MRRIVVTGMGAVSPLGAQMSGTLGRACWRASRGLVPFVHIPAIDHRRLQDNGVGEGPFDTAFDEQSKALEFYTKTLGFIVKHDVPLGENRWLTSYRVKRLTERNCC